MSSNFTSGNFTSTSGGLDFDKIFDTGRVVIDASQAMYDGICNAMNDAMDPMSRRNVGGYQNPQYAPQMPRSYNYGYEEQTPNYYPMNSFGFNTQNQQQVSGYPGFWNPKYGKVGGV